jgi:hypothetical protein
MDKLKIAEALGSHPYGVFWIQALRLEGWGRDLVFECVYEPGGPSQPVPFLLTLKDCREMRWRVYAHADGLPSASIVNIILGTGQHRKPANILTDYFGLTVLYGEYVIEKQE